MAKFDIYVDIKGAMKVDDLTKQTDDLTNSQNKNAKSSRNLSKENDKNVNSIARLAASTASLIAVASGLSKVTKAGFSFNSAMEDSIAGLSALNVATSANTSLMGEALSISEKYELAQQQAIQTASELAQINSETPHTLNQTNQIYKAMFVSMKKAGATSKDMVSLTKQLSIAAGAAGIEFNSLLAGVDGLATGTVMANSDLGRFLGGLGLTNEELKKTDDVISLLNETLSEFQAVDTMSVAVSNLSNEWEQLAGILTKDIFEATKEHIKSTTSWLSNYRSQVNSFLLQYKDASDITEIENINIKLIQLNRELRETNEKTSASWTSLGKKFWSNEDKKKHSDKIQSIQDEIKILTERTTAIKDADSLTNKGPVSKEVFADTEEFDLQIEFDRISAIWDEEERKEEAKQSLIERHSEIQLQADYDRIAKVWDAEEQLAERLQKQKEKDHESYIDDLIEFQNIELSFKVETTELDRVLDKISSTDWTSGLSGQAKGIANISNSFADLNDFQKSWNELNEEDTGTQEAKNKKIEAQAGLYGNVAGAISNMAEEGSSASKIAQVAQTSLAVVQGVSAILNQGSGDPYTAAFRMAAMAAMVAQTLSSINASAGSSTTLSAGSQAASQASTFKELSQATDLGGVDFKSFEKGLKSSSKALEDFGSIGTSLSDSIEAIYSQLSFYKNFNDSDVKIVTTGRIFHKAVVDGKTFRGSKIRIERDVKNYINAQLSNYENKLEEVLIESSAELLDFDLLSSTQIKSILGNFDISGYDEIVSNINDLSIKAKQLGIKGEQLSDSDMSRLVELYTLPEYKKGQDWKEIIDIVKDEREGLLSSISSSSSAAISSLSGSLSPEANISKFNESMRLANIAFSSGNIESLEKYVGIANDSISSLSFGATSLSNLRFEEARARLDFEKFGELAKSDNDLLSLQLNELTNINLSTSMLNSSLMVGGRSNQPPIRVDSIVTAPSIYAGVKNESTTESRDSMILMAESMHKLYSLVRNVTNGGDAMRMELVK